jgi:DNA polymerase-3 subunit alpha
LLSKKTKIPLVATNDCHYLKPEDAKAQDILMLINTNANPNDPERLTMISDDFSMRKESQMIEDFKETPEAIENTQRIVESCNFQFELGKIKLPQYPLPEGKNPDEYLKELCYQRIKEKYGILPFSKEKILQRLNHELSVIKETGFASYFLIVQDFVNWAKENKIVVGPGRGSVSGSLVAYLLNITNIDPLKYNLLFERFLSDKGSRVSPPDIDLDFTDLRRDEVIKYVAKKYGKDRVAQIITFGTMAARAVIRDVGRALNYPYTFCDQIAKMIPFGFSLDETLEKVGEFSKIYQRDEKAKKLIDLAKKLEGVARHASTHACGVVISTEPLTKLVPLQHPSQSEENIVTQYEMHSIEDLGLLKIDLLGLKNLTIIENTKELIKKRHNLEIDIENLPLNDKKTYKLLQEGETTGVFQLESEGMKRYLRQLKPTEFEDIISMLALYRPGPMELIPEYIARKQKRKKIEYLHPKLKPILESTQGICIFQEQLMQIAKDLAGFTLTEADLLRKAVSKKIKSLLLSQKEKFIKGAENNKIKKEVAEKIWQLILPFAKYGFNRAHTTAYAQIAYQTAFLKAHYPVEFMSALLNSEKQDIERIAFLIEECQRMGIKVLPPDINESEETFCEAGENIIRFGLGAIKNVGSNMVRAIVKEREIGGKFTSISDFLLRVNCKDLNKKSLESLIKAGVFDNLCERNQLLENLEKLLEFNRENQRKKLIGQRGLFDGVKFNEIKLALAKPASKNEKLNWEKELLGLFISSHPLEDYKNILLKETQSIAKIKKDFSQANLEAEPLHWWEAAFPFSKNQSKKVKIGGIISSIKKVLTKKGQSMLFLKLEDLTDKIEVIVFPSLIEENPLIFQENKIVLIKGRLTNKDDNPKVIAEEIEEITKTTDKKV